MSPDSTSDQVEPVYDEHYYQNYDGGAYERSPQWLGFFGMVADEIIARFAPVTVLDAGCAIGLLVEALVDRGVEAYGVDISEFAISQAPESVGGRVRAGSIAEPFDDKYDLIVCIEVLEHIDESSLQRALDNLCASTDRVLISSTPAHYDDPTHINVKQPEQWSAEFARRGFVRDLGVDASFLSPWAVLYHRSTRAWPQVIEDYDRQFWYQRREIQETRQGILQQQRRLAWIEQQDGPLTAREQHLELEVLRLRDELRVAERRAGASEGSAKVFHQELQIAAARLEDVDRRAREAVEELDEVRNSASWRLIWKLMAPYRALRGQR